MAKRRAKAKAKSKGWRDRLGPLLKSFGEWLSGLNRFVVCGGCKRVLDTTGGAGVFDESTLGWTIELDGRGWLCPMCQRGAK